MSDDNLRTLSGIDTSRRSVLQKGAVATGALALGGSTVGWAIADQHDDENDMEDDDYVLMLYPDAVEQSSATVVSDEIDWQPWNHDEDDAEDVGENDDDVDADNDDQEYRTHLVEFDFSASHVAPVFVPDDAEIELDEEINLGEIRELLHGPGDPLDEGPGDGVDDDPADDDDTEPDDDTDNGTQQIGENGQAVLVEIALEDDPVDDDIDDDPDDDIEDEPDDDSDDDVGPDDDIDDDNGPDDEPENDDDDGLLNY